MRLRPRDESGAIAIMTALLMVVVLAVAALGVDISTQVNARQKLHDTIDAAAHAGAYRLPSPGATAASDAKANALANDPALTGALIPTVNLYCVVASKLVSGSYAVDTSQIPTTCNPVSAAGAYTVSSTLRCNSRICAIPCDGASDVCNTVKVSGIKPVPFSFAPAAGITQQGSTGSVSSAACKGSCGTVPLNPMDVAVVADRTGSMSSTDINAMITGIKGMFQVMTPSQQFVSLGTIGRSKKAPALASWCGSTGALSEPSTSETEGPWVPVPFSADYLTAGTVNASSTLVKAVECLKNSSGTGTHLASPLKYAARYLLGLDSNNLGTFPARSGTIRKAIIFETDGAPNESINTSGSLALNVTGDIENTNKDTACNNFKTVAANAKAATPPILVVTVAFNISSTDTCSGSGTANKLGDVMAAAASPVAGVASAANFNCADASATGGRYKENHDGDYFFCAGTGTDMAEIFKTAFTQIANGIRLIALP
jgi:hypothetical protein